MLIYFVILAYPLIFALVNAGKPPSENRWNVLAMLGFWILYNFISAIRDNTAGDWYTYDEMVYLFKYMSLGQAMLDTDPAFGFFGWIGSRLGLGLYFANFICSAILSWGVLRLASRLPNPWVAITAAVPYLLIVVGYGYIRQAAAIGLLVSAICDLQDRRHFAAAIQALLAATFHNSAVVMFPLLVFAVVPRNLWTLAAFTGATLLLTNLLLATQIASVYQVGYIDQEYKSSGATVRVLMNIVPAMFFVVFHRNFGVDQRAKRIWELFAWGSVVLFIALFRYPGSTAIDRLALYLLPIQVYVFGYVVSSFANRGRPAQLLTLACVAYLTLVQMVWFFRADHAYLWVPYQSIFSETITPMVFR